MTLGHRRFEGNIAAVSEGLDGREECHVDTVTVRVRVAERLTFSQSTSQPASQSASQPVSQSASQPLTQSMSQSVSQPGSQSVSQSVSQSTRPGVETSLRHMTGCVYIDLCVRHRLSEVQVRSRYNSSAVYSVLIYTHTHTHTRARARTRTRLAPWAANVL
jgi:hypothetical protein